MLLLLPLAAALFAAPGHPALVVTVGPGSVLLLWTLPLLLVMLRLISYCSSPAFLLPSPNQLSCCFSVFEAIQFPLHAQLLYLILHWEVPWHRRSTRQSLLAVHGFSRDDHA